MYMNRNKGTPRILLAMSLAMAWCCGPAVTAEPKGGDTEKVSAATYCGVRTIRSKIQLRNEAIAAMGCGKAVAGEVLEAILVWYEVKEPYLSIAKKAKIKAARDLRTGLQKIGMGKADDKLLKSVPALKAALARAIKDYDDIIKTAITAVEAKLSPAQKALWATARANANLHSRYRYVPNMTAAQAKALHVARRARARRMAAAKKPAARAAVAAEYKAWESNILTAAQKIAMAQAAENIRKNMQAVSKAESEVLPLPDELKAPEPGIDPLERPKP